MDIERITLPGLLVLGVAALVVLLATRSGWRRGASRPVLALVGTVAGVVAGFEVAAWLDGRWPQTGWNAFALVAGSVLVVALVGAALGSAVGGALAAALRTVHLQVLDRVAGALVRGGLAVVVCALAITLVPGDVLPRQGLPGQWARDTVGQSVDTVGRNLDTVGRNLDAVGQNLDAVDVPVVAHR